MSVRTVGGRRVATLTALLLVAAAGAGAASASAAAPGVVRLSGTLRLSAGTCAAGQPTGSYLSVTFGTRAIDNSASSCDGGAVTLLSPGRSGLSTTEFSPASDESFDSGGNAVATAITRPVTFGPHRLGLVSAAQDLQDAPTGAGTFSLPHIYVTGDKVLADVRSVQILYGGQAGTCATDAGAGCWTIGAERATGTYDAQTRRMTLSWFSGESFVPQSAGTAVHLSGIFVGAPKPVAHGKVVELGTSSFAAGPAPTASIPSGVAGRRREGVRASTSAHPNSTASATAAASQSVSAAGDSRGLPEGAAAVLLLGLIASFGAVARTRGLQ